MDALPNIDDVLDDNFNCNWSTLYEAVCGVLKSKLLELQKGIKGNNEARRVILIKRIERMTMNFGFDSEQTENCIKDLNNFDNEQLKDKANKYKDFLIKNNEKPTKAFCLLGKENNLSDDMNKIKKANGEEFNTKDERKEYIANYYSNLYKKKLDNIIGIEDFLDGIEDTDIAWINNQKLNEEEKLSLENNINFEEIKKGYGRQQSRQQLRVGWGIL